jgi:hypothetical protein
MRARGQGNIGISLGASQASSTIGKISKKVVVQVPLALVIANASV